MRILALHKFKFGHRSNANHNSFEEIKHNFIHGFHSVIIKHFRLIYYILINVKTSYILKCLEYVIAI